MIDLYTAPTPNGWKISVALEELDMPYTVKAVDLTKGEQKSPEFLKMNPNGRIPVIVDRSAGDLTIFESGAILIYLAKKAGKLMPSDTEGEMKVLQWLMFQMGGVGPMMGQANVFYRYAEEKIPFAINRYQKEVRRLLEVLDGRLSQSEYLADDYSIADIANWCWVRGHNWSGVSIDGLDHLGRWLAQISERPAAQKGVKVPYDISEVLKGGDKAEEFAKEARKMVTK